MSPSHRMFFRCVLAASVVLTLNGCGPETEQGPGPVDGATPQAKYSWLNQNLFQPRCVSCHGKGVVQGGVDLSTYEKLLSTGSVVPGHPENSKMVEAIQNGRMPQGSSRLSGAEVKAVSDWVAAGALDDTSTVAGAAPKLTSVSPAAGPSTGGTPIIILGDNFATGVQLFINGSTPLNVEARSATSLRATTPPHAAGSVDLSVKNPDGQSATLPKAFTFILATTTSPVVSTISPTSGPAAGGTAVTLTGKNFVRGASVTLGGVACSSVTFASATQLTCTSAAHAAGAVDVVVTNPNQQTGRLTGGFTYVAPITATFAAVKPVLTNFCVGCHGGTLPAKGFDFSTYDKVMASRTVVAGSPSTSKMFKAVNSGAMPPVGNPKPSSAQITLIGDWIREGALNN